MGAQKRTIRSRKG